jgi:hypothetical protein
LVTAADGVELKGPVVQFIGGGDRILVRAADRSRSPGSLITVARRLADQLRSGDGVRPPTSS